MISTVLTPYSLHEISQAIKLLQKEGKVTIYKQHQQSDGILNWTDEDGIKFNIVSP